jgi:hypothetical protein
MRSLLRMERVANHQALPVDMREGIRLPVPRLGDERDMAHLLQARCLAVTGPDGGDLVEGDEQVRVSQRGSWSTIIVRTAAIPSEYLRSALVSLSETELSITRLLVRVSASRSGSGHLGNHQTSRIGW